MTDTTVKSPAPRKRRGWLRAIGWVFGLLIVLLVVVYFVATSGAFLKGVILPRVSKAMGAEVTVADASISPFKQVILHNLKVQTTGPEPLVTAAEVRLRYSLMAIIGGNIRVDEVALSAPTITLVENADGTSNLDPILKAQQGKPEEKKPAQPGKPMQLDLKKFSLTDARIRQVKNHAKGAPDVVELSHVNVTLDDLKNGGTGKLALGAYILVENTNGVLQAKMAGSYDLTLTADLKPAAIKGSTHLDVTSAAGGLAEMATLGTELDVEVTPTDIKGVVLSFKKGDTRLGELRVSGPFDMAKNEGRLSIALTGIDKRLLNVAGAKNGMDFGPTSITSTNLVELTKGGQVITASGRVDINSFQLTRTNQTTPKLDLRKEYNVTVDLAQSNAVLHALSLTGLQDGKTLLKAELTSPMQVSWGKAGTPMGDSALTLTVSDFNLADWKPFIGDSASAGIVNAKGKVLSQQGGQQVTFDLDSRIDHLTVKAGSNQVADATVTLQVNGNAKEMNKFELTSYKFEVAHQNQTLTSITGSGTYDKAAEDADIQVALHAALAPLLKLQPQPDTSISSGTVDVKVHVTQKQQAQAVVGNLALADFTGHFGKSDIRSLGLTADFDVATTPKLIQVRKASGKLTQGANAGGSFDLTATYDPTSKTASLTAKLVDLNQNGIGQFLEPMLADKKLVSVAINANASAQYDPKGASTVKADLQVANLVVKDPKGQFPATPLEAKMVLDTSLNKQVADVRQFAITLTPTARATNQVTLSGQVDMSNTNAIQGNLKLVADSIDVTSYYDLFMAGKQPPAKSATATGSPAGSASTTQPTPTAASAAANKEPDAMKLPLQNFIMSAAIGHFYLHEIDIAGWQTTVKIDGGHVVMNPFKLTLNGAPANTTLDMDLGVPGWKYDWALSAQAIPLAPIVNSFQPDRKGLLSGTLTAQAKFAGAGITGAGLQKNLTGQYDMTTTNLNLSVDNIQGNTFYTRMLKTLVSAIAIIPDLAKDPAAAGLSFLQRATGLSGTSASSGGGLMADLTKSPINSIVLRGAAGSGRVDLQQSLIQSPAFQAMAKGTITLDAVLTNSPLNIPISIALERGVAERIKLAGNTPTNATYALLPDFMTMKGTVGTSKMDYDKIALGKAVLAGVGGKGGQAGNALQGLSGFLPGGTSTNASSGTNPPAGGASSIMQGLGGLLGNKTPAATNKPATNTSPAKNLLKGFLGQ